MIWNRTAGMIATNPAKRVASVSVKIVAEDFSGTIWVSDLQLQDGNAITGYAAAPVEMLLKRREDGVIIGPKHYNALIRSEATVIIPNQGPLPAGIDYTIKPQANMAADSVVLGQALGAHRITVTEALSAGDTVVIAASTRTKTRNGGPLATDGPYQYAAAADSKHVIKVEQSKAAVILAQIQEMERGKGAAKL